MANCKCGKCGLVNHASEEMCKRCGSKINKNWKPFDVSETPSAMEKKSTSILPLVLLLPLSAGVYFYWNFTDKEQPKPTAMTVKAPASSAYANVEKPIRAAALEQANGKPSRSSISSTMQGSKAITQANARVAEMEKLMASETANVKK